MIPRKLWAWERAQLRAHLLRLSAEDRAWRFCHPAGDDAIHRYCDAIDWHRSSVIGCFDAGVPRGMAELVRIPGGAPAKAEVALSVEGDRRKAGKAVAARPGQITQALSGR